MNFKEKLSSQPLLKKFQTQKEFKSVVTNIGWLFADRILRMGVGLVVGVWIARYLGVEQFGIFNYAISFVGLFSTISSLGIPFLVVRTITHEPENTSKILGTAFWLQILGGCVTLLFSVITISVLRHDDPLMINMVAVLASVGIFQAFDTIDLWFQSQLKSKYTVLAKNGAFAIITLVKILLIKCDAPLLAFASSTLAETMIGVVWLIYYYTIQGEKIKTWQWSFSLAKRLLNESYPLILSGLAVTIYMKIDQIMLGEMIGSQSVGLYSSATRISEVWYFIPIAISSSVAPAIYAAKNEGNESLYYRRIRQLLSLVSFISIVVALPMSFLSGNIITMLFGNEYAKAGPILAVHIWAGFFVFTGVGSSPWFIAEHLTHVRMLITIMGAFSNVLLNLYLIPLYGGLGAAIATIISQAIATFIGNIFFPETRKIFKLQIQSMLFLAPKL